VLYVLVGQGSCVLWAYSDYLSTSRGLIFFQLGRGGYVISMGFARLLFSLSGNDVDFF